MSESMNFAGAKLLRIDDATANISYIGYGLIGTASSDTGWKILRLTTSSGVVTVEYADGNNNYDNVWDDRVSLSYS